MECSNFQMLWFYNPYKDLVLHFKSVYFACLHVPWSLCFSFYLRWLK